MNEPEYHESQPSLNPFVTVWLHPKTTARYIINQKTIPYALLIIAFGYIGSFCSGIYDTQIDYYIPLWAIVLLLIILSPILGIIITAIYTGVILLTGKLFKGIGNYKDLFKALSLTTIPYIILIPFYFAWLIVDPQSLFDPSSKNAVSFISIFVLFLTAVTSIWSIIINIAVVAEAEKFSNWKAFFTILIPTVILTVVITIIVLIIILIVFVALGANTF